jgi:hypothetical protein
MVERTEASWHGGRPMPVIDEAARGCRCQRSAAPLGHAPVAPVAMAENASWSMLTAVLSLLIAFFPKCPVCWAAYMNIFGSVWLAHTPYVPWLHPLLLGVSALNLLLLLRRARNKGYGPFLLGSTGFATILGGRSLFPQDRWLLLCGAALMVASSLVSSFTADRAHTSPLPTARKEAQS